MHETTKKPATVISRETLQPYLTLGSALALACGLGFGTADTLADEPAVARYSTLRAVVTEGQRDLLGEWMSVTFTDEVITVGAAVRAVLVPSGYQLADNPVIGEANGGLFTLPLPEAHRTLGPMPRRLALETLAGPAFVLFEDPVRRQVAFERCQPSPEAE